MARTERVRVSADERSGADGATFVAATPPGDTPAASPWRQNREIIGNAGSLVATSGLAGLLGFAYWAVAARLFTQAAVGYAAALISAMSLLATFGMFGLGTLLIAELPRRRARANLIAAALLTAGIASLIIGLVFVILAPHFSISFRHSLGTLAGASIVVSGVVITAATLVFDQAAIGLLRGGLQLARNSVFVVAKLLALPVVAIVLRDNFGTGIALSWVAGATVSVVPIAIWLWWKGSHVIAQPDWNLLRGMGKKIAAHNWLNIAVQAPIMLVPIVVTIVVSPAANGAFYAAWMLVSFLYILQTHLSTVLFAVAANDPLALPRKLRFTIRMSFLFGLPGMAVLALGGHLLLSIFGTGYASDGALPLFFLVAAYIPMIPRSYYIAVCRASGRIAQAAGVLTAAAMVDLTAVVVGARWHGLVGVALGLLAARVVTGSLTAPPVVRAAIGQGRHRRSEQVHDQRVSMPSAFNWTMPDVYGAEPSQQAGLAMLLLLSRPEDGAGPSSVKVVQRRRGSEGMRSRRN